MPAMYLADILSEHYESFFAVTNEILENLVVANQYKAISHSGFKPLFGMEHSYLTKEKKQKAGFWNLVKSHQNNEIYEFRKKELYEIVERINAKVVIIDIFSSTDFLVLNNHPDNLILLFFNPMLSTYQIGDFPIISDGTWFKNQSKTVVKQNIRSRFINYLKNPKESILNQIIEKQKKEILVKSGVSEIDFENENPFTKMFRNVPELISAPLEFEISPEIKQSFQYYLGLCTREKREDTELDSSFYEDWQVIVSKKEQGYKIVYCSFGTFYTGPDKALFTFLENLQIIVKELGNLQLVVSVNQIIIETLKDKIDINQNVFFFTKVPQLIVLKNVDLFITHGGLGSIKEAIEYEIPMLVYPLDLQYDQNGNALKVELHGIGLRGNFKFERAIDMKTKIERLLTQKTYKEKLKEMNQNIKRKYTKESNLQILNQLGL